MALDLSSVFSGVTMPNISGNDILNNLALGAITSAVSLGVQAKLKQDAPGIVDLIQGKQAASPNAPSAVGATITASAFAALPPATQAQLVASGVHIVAG